MAGDTTDDDRRTKALAAVGEEIHRGKQASERYPDAPAWATTLIERVEGIEARVDAVQQDKNAWKHELVEQVETLDDELSKIESNIEEP